MNIMLFDLGLGSEDTKMHWIPGVTSDLRVYRILANLWLILAVMLSLSLPLYAAEKSRQQMLNQPEKIPDWVSNKQIRFEKIPNPHWNKNDCKVCHRQTPAPGRLHLRGKNIDELCEYCHSGEFDHSYIHPNAVPMDAAMRKRVPKEFANNLGAKKSVSCNTCHELEAQCLPERRGEQRINSSFLRDGPYRSRTEICFKCHDMSGYQKRNAHDQIDDNGKIKEYTCRLCHNKTEGLKSAKSIREVGFNVKDNLIWVCSGCHPLKPHPSAGFSFTNKGVPNHLIVPPELMKKKMQQSEKEHQVIMPLDPITGRVFCGTCHNPHEKGVIKDRAAAKGADEPKRLRMKNICTNCHDK